MSTSTSLLDNRIESYLKQLEARLAGLQREERDDILREIRAHIVDATSADGAIEQTLRALGTPDELAQRYRTELLLTRAGRSFSPWVLLRTSWRWAKTGLHGFLVFLLALFGYGVGGALAIAVILKPVMPSMIGMWVGPGTFVIGTSNTGNLHEVLGRWFIPLMATIAGIFLMATTQGVRWLIRKRVPWTAH